MLDQAAIDSSELFECQRPGCLLSWRSQLWFDALEGELVMGSLASVPVAALFATPACPATAPVGALCPAALVAGDAILSDAGTAADRCGRDRGLEAAATSPLTSRY